MQTRHKWMIASVGACLGVSSWWLAARGRAAGEIASNGTDRGAVELTVYSQDFGMVREQRPVQLTQGGNRLHIPSVSRELDPQSVLLGWKDAGANPPQIVANAYDLGVGSGDNLLRRYLGQEVEVVRYGQDGHEAERQTGRLMVQDGNQVVLQSGDKFYVHPEGTVVAPTHADIVTIPQLSVQADSAAPQAATLDVAYLTRGMSWTTDYVARLSPSDGTLALEAWATVTNRTGVDYPNAKVTLIAGSPNRAVTEAPAGRVMMAKAAPVAEDAGRDRAFGMARQEVAAPEAVGDNYAYPIKNPTTVVQEQMNRLMMLSSDKVAVTKDYNGRLPELSAWDNVYEWGTPAQPGRGNVNISLTFFNTDKNGLGQPLPAGAIRVYEPDKSGTLRYAGAASLVNTPKEQKINFTLAEAFDLFTERRVVHTQKLDKHTLRKQVEITVHNEKSAPATVRLAQPYNGRWTIVTESLKHNSLDAQNVEWSVPTPASGKTTLMYTVDFRI